MKIIASVKKGYVAEKAAENLRNAGFKVVKVYPFYGLINIEKSEDLGGVNAVEGIELAVLSTL